MRASSITEQHHSAGSTLTLSFTLLATHNSNKFRALDATRALENEQSESTIFRESRVKN